ncbi:hypothetical protein [Embleya sp. NBC_00896]|uniref:hypothetical protein n=1 Tax=Embleya sp. NBC_00896 TaxID=2975961 RepID=UPI002F910E81|nr:hypothetical protein OG928_36140 [Embleya sp. NBC_00896]
MSAALLTVLVGCSDDGGGRGAPRPDAAVGPEQGAKGGQVPWTGPALPGLAGTPAWSAPRDKSETGVRNSRDAVRVVGGGVVIVHEQATTPGGAGTDKVAWFHDARAGALRATVSLKGIVSVETWRGMPALVTREERKVPASGLTAERSSLLVTAFDEQGRRIAVVDLTMAADYSYKEIVSDGWVIRRGAGPDGKQHVWARTADTPDFGPPVVTCGDRDKGCSDPGDFARGAAGSFALGTVFTIEYDKAALVGHVVATDAATGQRRWSTATVTAPPGTPTDAQARDRQERAVVLGPVGDKILLGWYTNETSNGSVTMGRGPMLLGLYDPVTGRLATPGPAPRVQSADFAYHLAPDGAVLYLSNRDQGGPHALAWQVTSGTILWQQTPSERPVVVWQIVNGAAYAAADASTSMSERVTIREALVLSAADKSVLADPGPAGELIPQVATGGYGVVATNERVWVFPPKPVT